MMISIEKKRAEAERRLEILCSEARKYCGDDVMQLALKSFKKGDIGIFEYQNNIFNSIFYNLNGYFDEIELRKAIEEFQNNSNEIVYLVQRTNTSWGVCYSFFYVSDDMEEWEDDVNCLINAEEKLYFPYVYVANISEPLYSEYGKIGYSFSMNCGGIVRMY